MRFLVNFFKFIFLLLLLTLGGLAIYTLFFNPTTPPHEVTQEIQLSS